MKKTFLTKSGMVKSIDWDIWTNIPDDYIWELSDSSLAWVKRKLKQYKEAGLKPDGEKLMLKYRFEMGKVSKA